MMMPSIFGEDMFDEFMRDFSVFLMKEMKEELKKSCTDAEAKI